MNKNCKQYKFNHIPDDLMLLDRNIRLSHYFPLQSHYFFSKRTILGI